MLHIRIASFRWSIVLSDQKLFLNGHKCRSICDCEAQRIIIDRKLSPDLRLAEAWRQIGHAIRELDTRPECQMNEDAFAHLLGVAMPSLEPLDIWRLKIYMLYDTVAQSVVTLPSTNQPILMVREVE